MAGGTRIHKAVEVRPGVICEYHKPLSMRLEIIYGSYEDSESADNPFSRPKSRGVVVQHFGGDETIESSALDHCLQQMLLKPRFMDGEIE